MAQGDRGGNAGAGTRDLLGAPTEASGGCLWRRGAERPQRGSGPRRQRGSGRGHQEAAEHGGEEALCIGLHGDLQPAPRALAAPRRAADPSVPGGRAARFKSPPGRSTVKPGWGGGSGPQGSRAPAPRARGWGPAGEVPLGANTERWTLVREILQIESR